MGRRGIGVASNAVGWKGGNTTTKYILHLLLHSMMKKLVLHHPQTLLLWMITSLMMKPLVSAREALQVRAAKKTLLHLSFEVQLKELVDQPHTHQDTLIMEVIDCDLMQEASLNQSKNSQYLSEKKWILCPGQQLRLDVALMK